MAIIISQISPKLCMLRISNGKVFRRNQFDIRPSVENFVGDEDDNEDKDEGLIENYEQIVPYVGQPRLEPRPLDKPNDT